MAEDPAVISTNRADTRVPALQKPVWQQMCANRADAQDKLLLNFLRLSHFLEKELIAVNELPQLVSGDEQVAENPTWPQ